MTPAGPGDTGQLVPKAWGVIADTRAIGDTYMGGRYAPRDGDALRVRLTEGLASARPMLANNRKD